jgi:hypothetical protein
MNAKGNGRTIRTFMRRPGGGSYGPRFWPSIRYATAPDAMISLSMFIIEKTGRRILNSRTNGQILKVYAYLATTRKKSGKRVD